ncbi:MAG: hypothetical protein GY925_07880 [Actinomycetia bacterium]|nr:hypothetical protein [Actinomycetes bacterium]
MEQAELFLRADSETGLRSEAVLSADVSAGLEAIGLDFDIEYESGGNVTVVTYRSEDVDPLRSAVIEAVSAAFETARLNDVNSRVETLRSELSDLEADVESAKQLLEVHIEAETILESEQDKQLAAVKRSELTADLRAADALVRSHKSPIADLERSLERPMIVLEIRNSPISQSRVPAPMAAGGGVFVLVLLTVFVLSPSSASKR